MPRIILITVNNLNTPYFRLHKVYHQLEEKSNISNIKDFTQKRQYY